jgi:hypothetical protein
MKRRTCRVGPAKLAGGVLILFSSNAKAGFTEVVANRFGEPGPQQVVAHLYGESFTQSGENFVGDTVTATRLEDGTPAEALTGEKFLASAVARFSNFTQTYGVINSVGTFTPVFTASGEGYNVSGSGTIKVNAGESFGRTGNSGMDSSTPSQNADGRDHVVTYKIDGAKPDPQFLQFWEDLNIAPDVTKGRSKADFNDLVVRLESSSAGGGNGVTVPLPPVVMSGGALGLLMLIRKRMHGSAQRGRPFGRG